MKKFKLFLMTGLILSMSIMVACSSDDKDDDPEPTDLKPTIAFKTGGNYIHSDVDLTTAGQILVGVTASANASSEAALTQFKLQRNPGNSPVIIADSAFSAATFNADFQLDFPEAGTYTIQAQITDADSETAEVSFTISVDEVQDGSVAVKKITNLVLASIGDTIGSFYSTTHEEIYNVEEAAENQEKVDFLYWKDPRQFDHTISSPDSPTLDIVTPLGVAEWETRNETRLILTDMSIADFDAIENTHIFPAFDLEEAHDIITHLENDQIIYFMTEAGKRGYIKIVDLYTRADRALLELIVEE